MADAVAIPSSRTRGISWTDAIAARIERLPAPAWSVYALLAAAAVAYVAWVGAVEGRDLQPAVVLLALQVVYALAVGHYLARASRDALARFRPLLGMDDAAFARLEREFATLSPRAGAVSAAVGLAATVATLVTSPPESFSFYAFGPSPMASLRDYGWLLALTGVAFGPFFYRIVRQLRFVAELHGRARGVDVLRPGPAHAFAPYTMRAALAILAIPYAWLGLEPAAVAASPVLVGVAVGFTALAIGCFILPLWGMHQRLVADRDRLLSDSRARFEAASAMLHARIDTSDFRDADPLNKFMSSLIAEHELLLKVPTWPWRPETLNTFVTALLAPIALFLLTRALEHFVK